MLNNLTRLTAGGLKCERHFLDQPDRDLRLQQPQSSQPKKGISKNIHRRNGTGPLSHVIDRALNYT